MRPASPRGGRGAAPPTDPTFFAVPGGAGPPPPGRWERALGRALEAAGGLERGWRCAEEEEKEEKEADAEEEAEHEEDEEEEEAVVEIGVAEDADDLWTDHRFERETERKEPMKKKTEEQHEKCTRGTRRREKGERDVEEGAHTEQAKQKRFEPLGRRGDRVSESRKKREDRETHSQAVGPRGLRKNEKTRKKLLHHRVHGRGCT